MQAEGTGFNTQRIGRVHAQDFQRFCHGTDLLFGQDEIGMGIEDELVDRCATWVNPCDFFKHFY